MIPKRCWAKSGLNALVLSALLGLLPGAKAALAQTICAEVRLEIKQEATLEREAFDAALEVTNQYPSYGLTNFRVNVVIKDPQGRTADNSFFIKISSKEAINAVDGTGIVQPASTATIHWLIIPSTGAGGTNPLGLTYSVKADISYLLNGIPQNISTFEDTIQVKPQPALKLEYVLPFEVFADEALTADVIEPVEPFPLGVRITNVGYGPARNFQINSGQPEIIENKQNLAIDFKLLGTYVGDKKIPDTLLIPFGDISAGGVSQAAWIMATSLSGRFVKFDASFTHAAELGGQLTSLIQGVTTYTLIKDMLVDLPGRDGQFDFLVNTTTPRGMMQTMLDAGQEIVPDLILESDQAAPIQVVRLASELTGQLNGANTSATLRLTESSGSNLWVFTSMPAPLDGKAKLVSAVRQDGKNINLKNIWVSRHFNKNNSAVTYRLNLIDYNPPPLPQYTLNFSRESLDAAPAPITDLNAYAVPLGGQTGLNWSATGEDVGSGTILGGRYLIQAATSATSEFSPNLAQVNFTTNTAPGIMQTYLMKDLAGNASHYLKLWIQDTGGNISTDSNLVEVYVLPNPPADLVVGAISSNTVAVSWNGGNNNLPVEYGVWADTDTVLPAVVTAPFKDPFERAFIFEGLTPNTTYLFYGLAKNPVCGIASEQVYLGQALTHAAAPGLIVSSQVFVSSFSVAWDSGVNPTGTEYFVQLSTAQDWSALAGESGWVDQPAYAFSGLATDTTYYARAKARNSAGVETTYTDLGILKTNALDTLAPVTALSFAGPGFGTEPVYVSSLTEISLNVYDDVSLDGDKRGVVAAVYYSVDSTTFSVFSDNFNIVAGGAHLVRYFSVDTAGNIEALKTSTVTVDIVSPAVLVEIAGVVFSTGEVSYIPAASTVTLRVSDEASGVKELYYAVNGSTYSIAAGSKSLSLAEGVYTLAYSAADNLGNASRLIISSITADYTPPHSVLEVLGSSQTIDGKFYIRNGSSLTLSASDAFSGVKEMRYNLDGSTAAAASPLMLLVSTGAHVLSFYAIDNVANLELGNTITFLVDVEAPITTSAVAGLMGANGWHISPVTLTLISTDAMSGVAAANYSLSRDNILISSGSYISPITEGEDGIYDYSYSSLDKAGNLEPEKTGSFKIDMSSPALITLSTPAANAAGWNNSAVTAMFSGTDSVSAIEYCTPNVVFEFEGSNMTVPGYCRNYAGLSSTASAMVSIDTTTPISIAAVSGVYANGYYSSSVTVSIETSDALSGVAEREYSLDGSDFNIYASSVIVKTEGVHIFVFRARDNAGNQESAKTVTIDIHLPPADVTPPVTTLSVNGVEFADGATLNITSTDTVALTATDEGSGVHGRYYTVDVEFSTTTATTYVMPFTVIPGIHTVYYSAMDNAENMAAVRSFFVNIEKSLIVNFYPAVDSVLSILWQWDLVEGATGYRLFSSTGGALSGLLAGDATGYLQGDLTPNTVYGAYLSVAKDGSYFDSLVSSAVTLASVPRSIEMFNIAQDASLVIGQTNFVERNRGLGPAKLSQPSDVLFDKVGDLWVADRLNNRILRFSPPFSTGMSANLVIGEPNFYTSDPGNFYTAKTLMQPSGLAFDAQGNLWALGLGRVLRFSRPFSNYMNADLIIGADNFTAIVWGVAANRISFGWVGKINFDGIGNLWVTDGGNARVMRFRPPFTNGMNADLVIGQQNFTSSLQLSPPSASSLNSPAGLNFDALGNLWIADDGNDRVLKFKQPFYSGMSAELVLGQQNSFSNNRLTETYPYKVNESELTRPTGVEFDPDGSLYVADAGNSRVLKFRPPFSTGMAASFVLGQYDFNSRVNMDLSGSFSFPLDTEIQGALSSDAEGRLWVADLGYHRVLRFDPVRNGTFKEVGSSSFTISWLNNGNPTETYYLAEISKQSDFSSAVLNSGYTTATTFQFLWLSGNTNYYARVKAKNISGAETEYLNLGSVLTKSDKVNNLIGTPYSPESILWTWSQPQDGVELQVYSSTGGAISGILAPGTTYFIQTSLAANQEYGSFIRSGNSAGYQYSDVAYQTTFASKPRRAEPFLSGQNADLVIGQINFVSSSGGTSASKMNYAFSGAIDAIGALWVSDLCRILRFTPPFFTGMSADLVIGQADFTSRNCITGAGTFSGIPKIAVDTAGALWVSDSNANRVLRYQPPFTNGMSADLVIGQPDFAAASPGTSANKFRNPKEIRISGDGSLWVADAYNYRLLRFSPPFSTGMAADLVLGQPNFTSANYSYNTTASIFVAEAFDFDGKGNLWLVDKSRNRVLKFSPPYSNGMPASFVLGQTDFTQPPNTNWTCLPPAVSNFCSPDSLAFDRDGNLYLGEAWNRHRVIKYKPPFTSIMNASVVIGQNDFSSTAYALTQNKFWTAPAVISQTVQGKESLWVADSQNKRILRFNEMNQAFSNVAVTSMVVVWDGNNNSSVTEYSAQVSTDSGFQTGLLSSPWHTGTTAVFAGLSGNTTYYARVKSRNSRNIEGDYYSLGYANTLEEKIIITESSELIGGNPEISLSSMRQMTILQVSSVSAAGIVAIGSAAAQNLILASNMYDIGPEGIYEPPAYMTFTYSTATFAALEILESDIGVYEHFVSSGWVRLPGQILDTQNHRITVPITQIASLFGIFGMGRDKTAPVSEFLVSGSSWGVQGAGLYVNAGASISLSALDPVVYGTSSGVAFTEFRVDAGTTAPFALYSGEFTLSAGTHKLEFRSSDNAGNIESAKTADIVVDGEAPLAWYTVAGSSFSAGDVLYAASGSTITIISSDTASGIKELHYGVNGSTYSSSAWRAEIYLSSGGAHSVAYYAVDNVGNTGSVNVVLVYVDTTTPASALSLAGSSGRGDWYLSAVDAIMGASDDSSGIRDILYSLDGSSFTSYVSSFSVLSEGTHTIKAYSLDNVLNTEGIHSAAFGIDISTPLAGYSYLPASNSEGWNNTSVDVVFSGTDTVSGIEYCSSSFTLAGEGLGIPVSGYCADYAGWTSTVSFSVNIDTTAPSSNAEIAAAHGLSGWLLTPAGITLTSTDSLSGIVGLYYSVDGSSFALYSSSFAVSGEGAHSLKYYSVDRAGNKEAERELAFKLDLNSPIVSAVPGPAANHYGWNNTAVSVVFSGTDTMSGLTYCEPEKMVETEGSSQTVTGYCSDYAGRSSTVSLTVSVDTTAPNLSYAPEPLANQLGWNNSDVALNFACADSLSGVKSCPADILFSSEGVNISTSGAVYDYAGNSGDILVSGIKIDKTAPISTAAVSGVYENDWYSSPVILVLASTDSLSGLKGIMYSLDVGGYSEYTQPVVVSSEGNHVLSYYAEDLAGNTESARTIDFAIDATAPMVDYLLNPPANSIGWNSSPVRVLFRGSDTLSGIVDCSSVTVAIEGKGQEMIGWCRDLAGNIAYATATLNIDLTRPLVSADQAPASNASGWNNGPVEINFTGADALSGIAYCEPVKTVSAAGAGQTVTGYCADYAGLTSTATLIVNIDTTAPSLSYAPEPAANLMGWNNSDVLLKFTCADGLSGVKACPADILLAGEGVNISTSAAAFDLAGNIRYTTATLNIDRTPPAITISSPAAGQVFIATRGDIGVKFGVMDNLDPAPAYRAWLEEVEDRGSPRGARPARLAVSDGQAIEPLGIDDGIWRLTVSATDFADNAALLSGGTFEVIHDVLAPRTGHSLTAGPSLVVGATTYIASAARLELTSIDDLVSANDGIGLGVKDQSIRVKSGGFLVKELLFANPAPKQGEAFTSSFTGAGLGVADGIYDLAYNASDVLGNIETEKSVLIGLDDTAPASSAGLAGTAGGNGWHISTVTINLTATDALSGVAGISYGLDGGAYLAYTSPVETAAEGQRTVRFYARDRLGNTEAGKSVDFKIDRTAPVVIATITPAANAADWHNGTVKAGFSGNDAVSGIAYCEPAGTMRDEGRGLELSGYCRDQAGLTSTATARFNVDLTSPTVVVERAPLANMRGWNNTDVKVTFTCGDALSSIKSCPSAATLAGEGAGQGASGTAADYADNIASAYIGGINIDKTAPASSLSVFGDLWESGSDKYLGLKSKLSLAAADGLSGVEAIEYRVDEAPFGIYSSSFSLLEGIRTIHYRAIDKADNVEATRTALYRVDGTGPATFLKIVGGMQHLAPEPGSFYASLASRFTLEAVDPVANGVASGVRQTSWSDNGGAISYATEGLAFAEGRHILAYSSIDNVNNLEVAGSTTILVDNTPPVTTHHIGSPYYTAGGLDYITPATPITFTAEDSVSGNLASGVSRIEVALNGSDFSAYTTALKFSEGRHTIKYRAVDNVGNMEAERVLEVRSDNTAPVSTWSAAGGDRIERGNKFYLNALGRIAFESADPVISDVASGVEGLYYGIDAVPADKYAVPIGLAEGIRIIKFSAKDNVGNTEVLKSTIVYVDGTKPITVLSVSGDQYKSERQYISRRTDIVIAATDPVVNDVSVGVMETKYAVDGAAFSDYSQFKLDAEGRRLVSFYSADHVNNVEVAKTAELWVDDTAPLSVLDVLGGNQYPGADPGSFYASLATKFGFVSVDPVVNYGAAGVKAIEYVDNGGAYVVYAQPISLGEGNHTITYRAIDRVENTEVFGSTQVYIDNTAPVTSFNIAGPLYIQDGVRYITPVSALTFSAIDPLTKEVAAGVERIETAVDGGQWLKYTQALKFAEGRHTIKYRAIDNVGNTEAEKTLELRSDNTPPASKWRVNSGDSVELGGRFYLNTQGKITLESVDPIVAEVTSGLEGLYYGINTAPAGKYSAPFGLAEGIRTINFSARDNVGNTEVVKSTVIYVDGTGPVSGLTLTGDQYHGDKVHISTRTGIVITSVDPIVNEVASGLKETKYSVDGGLFVNYSLFRLSAEGKRLVSYYSADYVANTETVKTAALWVDNTPPSTELTVAGARYTAPGDEKLYITGDSGIALTSLDSISNDTASGLLLTKYRIDNGNWQVYSGSFTIAAEGLHTLEYYALDRVQNAEPLKTINLAVDNTPPAAAISFGESEAEAFGLPLLTPSAKITLSALDPVVNGAASGLNSIFYEIKNMQTGALTPVTAYLSPFTMPGQGTFSIRYWSKDNTGNTETSREQIAAVTTWLEDGLAAVSGLEMSGTADISGAVKSNAVVSLAGNTRILGDVTASTITLTGKAQVTGLQVSGAAPVNPAPIILDVIIQSAQAVNQNKLVAGYLADGKLILGSKTGITLTAGTYYFKGMELSGGSSITVAGKVDILVEGGIAINGGSSMNASGAASLLSIIVSSSSELTFTGGGSLAAYVYAPYSQLKLAGNALLGGHYFVKRAVLSGAGNILQAGEALPVAVAPPGGGPKTKVAAMPSGSFGILAGPDPAFRLGEVYVFPNPAKGGEAPVFHIETGIADTVKINIYTISGRAAHERTLAGMPAELDDGNGLSYAYEYAWRGHIPSGVYLYYIETQKAGQKLKKTGKFSVVR